MDNRTLNGGRDKHVPPKNGPDGRVPPRNHSEGHACRARWSGMGYPTSEKRTANASLHWTNCRVRFYRDRYSVSIQISAKVVKAKAFTKSGDKSPHSMECGALAPLFTRDFSPR